MTLRARIGFRAWPLLAAVAAAAACTPDFQSPRDVTDLRVLAIRQEVPDPNGSSTFADAFVDLTNQTVQDATVKVLVVDPQPRAALAVNAQVCSPTDSGRCDDGPALDLGTPPSSSSGLMEQEPQYTLKIPPEVVAAALQSDDLKGFGGVRVQFSMQAADGDPHGPVAASKILLYTTAADTQRNHNPEIAALEITRDGAHVATVEPGGTLPLVSGVEYGVRPVLAMGPAGIEEYDTTDLSGNAVHLREEPRYSFFSTAPVSFDRDEADEPLADQPEPTNGLARLTATGNGGVVWVVVRDGRGGIGWISVQCVVST
jgi:hypothetical protein